MRRILMSIIGVSFSLAGALIGGCKDKPAVQLATATIGTEGGALEVPSLSLTLTVPPGAVDSDTVFTISESTQSGPSGMIGSVVQFEPEGVEFDPPLELSYALAEDDLATGAYMERLEIVTYDESWERVGNEIVDYEPDEGTFSMMAYVEHFSDWAIRDTGATGTLYGIQGPDLGDLTAAGEDGLVRYASGSTTTEATANETWFDYTTDGVTEYIVGVDATRTPRLRTRPVSGGNWTNATIPGINALLRGIHGEGSTVIAVGFLGRILAWDGSTWQDESVSGAGHLYDVHVLGGGAAMAVGAGSTVLIRNGGTWTADAIPANLGARLSLRGVWGSSTTDYYVVGSSGRDGVILHRTAGGWTNERTETRRSLYGVSGSATNTRFVGAGVLLRRGANGTYVSDNLVDSDCSPTTQSVTLYDLFVDPADAFVAVGSNGQIVSNVPCGTDAGTPMTGDSGTDAGSTDAGTDAGTTPLPTVGTGWDFTCAFLPSRDAVRCWGSSLSDGPFPGSDGRLGYGPTVTSPIGDTEFPSSAGDVPLGGAVAALSVGRNSSCALMTSNAALRCWGAGALGYGSAFGDYVGDDETPASAGDLNLNGAMVSQVALAAHHTCALLADGNVRCWGVNNVGELGYENTDWIEDASLAGNVDIGGTVIRLEAGDYHVCALMMGGGVRCWGSGDSGQLGYGGTEPVGDNETPAEAGDLPLGEPAVDIAIGGFHSCALLQSGSAKCWGLGTAGQLGYGMAIATQTTIPVADVVVTTSPGRSVTDLVAGFEHTCALLDDGSVACWGENQDGQLGYARPDNVGDNETPASAGTVDVGGTVVQLSADRWHTCAVLTTGGIRCWGRSTYGELGYANTATIGDNEAPSTQSDVMVE